MANCKHIIIIASPEQIPLLKLKYGDAILNTESIDFEEDQRLINTKVVELFYISPSIRYKKMWSYHFNILHIADAYLRAHQYTFEHMGPNKFFICLPWIVINPYSLIKKRQDVRDAFYLTQDKRVNNIFQYNFLSDNERFHPFSHSTVYSKYLQNSFKTILPIHQSGRQDDYFIDLNEKYSSISFPKQDWYDLSKWKEYIKLCTDIAEEDDPIVHFKMDAKIYNMPRLASFNDLKLNHDLNFSTFKIDKKENPFHEWKRWKKRRKKRLEKMNKL